jgi:thiosulfate/3-mercaptopyruvate sulfurtransferase
MNTHFLNSNSYAHPESLVSCDWLAEHLRDPSVRVIESNEDVLLYDTGHIPGAVHVDWLKDLNDQVLRDYLSPEAFAELAERIGITPETTLVFYGDKSNGPGLRGFTDLRVGFGRERKSFPEHPGPN